MILSTKFDIVTGMKDFEYFDIHSHPYFPDYDDDREVQIDEMKKANIATISIGTGLETSQKSIDLAEENENIFASVGQHPGDMTSRSIFDREIIHLSENKKVVAIGECGLDYFRLKAQTGEIDINEEDENLIKRVQKEIFEEHIKLSLHTQKPLMLHIRPSAKTFDAYFDALDILERYAKEHGDNLRGNAHFFAGDMEVLKRFLNIGFSISFTGVLTFTHDYDEYVKYAPLNMIMSETDAPFVSPIPHRGERNSSLYVPEVVKAIARIRGEDLENTRKAMVNNALKHFKI